MSALSRLLAHGEERPVLVAASLVALFSLLQWPFVDWYLRATGVVEPIRFYDMGVYLGALENWHAGAPIYQQNENGGYFGEFLYPPLVLLVFDLFDEMAQTTRWAWELFSLSLLWVGLQLVIRGYGLALRGWERGVLLWALVGFHPLWFSFKHGQVSIFLGGVLALALAALQRGESRPAGPSPSDRTDPPDGGDPPDERDLSEGWAFRVVSGTATTVAAAAKLTYMTAGVHLLVDRDRLLGAFAAGGLLAGVSLLVFGVDTHLRYLDVLRWGIASGNDPQSPHLMSAAYYQPLYALRDVATAIRVLGVVAVAGLALAAGAGDADTQTFVLGVTAMPLLAPQQYTYTFAALLPAIVALLAIEWRRDVGRPIVPVVALVLLHVHAMALRLFVDRFWVRFEFVSALQPVVGLLQPGLWGNLLLVGLATVRVAEHASPPAWLSPKLSHLR